MKRSRSRTLSKEESEENGSDVSAEDSEEHHEYNGSIADSLENHYTKLIEYKNNLFKIDTLISIEKDEKRVSEFVILRNRLKQAITLQEETVKLAQKNDAFIYNVDRLTGVNVERIVQAFHPRDKRWYHALITQIDLDKQEAKVSWLGYPETDKLKAMYIKLLPIPDISKLQQGANCEAINPQDGKWQGAVIEKILEKGYSIKFRKSGNKEVSIFINR